MSGAGSHSHTVWLMGNGGGGPSVTSVSVYGGSPQRMDGVGFTDGVGDHVHGISNAPDHGHAIAAEGANQAHENMPPWIAMNAIIRVR